MNEKKDYSHVYWIGGSPCSGKSTIAEMITKDYGYTYYQCDLFNEKHVNASNPSLWTEAEAFRRTTKRLNGILIYENSRE